MPQQGEQTTALFNSIQQMAAVVEKLTNGQATGSEVAKAAKPTPYSEYTVAALKGYTAGYATPHTSPQYGHCFKQRRIWRITN